MRDDGSIRRRRDRSCGQLRKHTPRWQVAKVGGGGTSLVLASMSAPLARRLLMRLSGPSRAAQWRAVAPLCGREPKGGSVADRVG